MAKEFLARVRGRAGLIVLSVVLVVGLLAGLAVLPRGSAAQEPGKPGKPGGAGQGATVPVQVVAVQPGALQQRTTLTGEFQSQDKLQVVSRISARVLKLPVEIGQAVKAGDTLAELDHIQLDAAVGQAQAQLASAKANLKKVQDGARPEDVAAAQAAARQASESLANAQVNAGAVRSQDLASAQAAVEAAEARLRQVTQGPTAAEIANAEAALRGAQARYQAVINGPRSQDIEIAAQALSSQKDNRTRLQSQYSNLKEQARINVELASSSMRSAQASFGAAKLIYDEAVRTGKDPNISADACPRQANGRRTNCNDLTDTKLRQYKAAFESAEQALRQAEELVQARQLSYEDAKQQEIVGLQQADTAIQTAEAQLDKLRAGSTSEDLDAARATVDQAQAALDRLQQPARQADIDAAQAAVQQARAGLGRTQAAPTTVGQAQAQVEQQQALAQKAANPFLPSDLEVAQAQVQVAEAGVKSAEANLRDATLVAPFAGVVSAKNVSEGALAAPGTVLLELVSSDVRGVFTIEEAQIGQVKLGQPATLSTTAFPGEKFPGTVSVINPTANTTTRSFGLKITPQDPQARLKSGMFAQAELVVAERTNALLVPENAVLTRDGKTIVIVVVDGKAQRREVVTGIRADGKIEIGRGLQAGDQVVVVGQNLVNDGDAVSVSTRP